MILLSVRFEARVLIVPFDDDKICIRIILFPSFVYFRCIDL